MYTDEEQRKMAEWVGRMSHPDVAGWILQLQKGQENLAKLVDATNRERAMLQAKTVTLTNDRDEWQRLAEDRAQSIQNLCKARTELKAQLDKEAEIYRTNLNNERSLRMEREERIRQWESGQAGMAAMRELEAKLKDVGGAYNRLMDKNSMLQNTNHLLGQERDQQARTIQSRDRLCEQNSIAIDELTKLANRQKGEIDSLNKDLQQARKDRDARIEPFQQDLIKSQYETELKYWRDAAASSEMLRAKLVAEKRELEDRLNAANSRAADRFKQAQYWKEKAYALGYGAKVGVELNPLFAWFEDKTKPVESLQDACTRLQAERDKARIDLNEVMAALAKKDAEIKDLQTDRAQYKMGMEHWRETSYRAAAQLDKLIPAYKDSIQWVESCLRELNERVSKIE